MKHNIKEKVRYAIDKKDNSSHYSLRGHTYYYNSVKPDPNIIHPTGYDVAFSSRTGGGSYLVEDHKNCEKCGTIVEVRKWTSIPRKAYSKPNWCPHYYWCHKCSHYEKLTGKDND